MCRRNGHQRRLHDGKRHVNDRTTLAVQRGRTLCRAPAPPPTKRRNDADAAVPSMPRIGCADSRCSTRPAARETLPPPRAADAPRTSRHQGAARGPLDDVFGDNVRMSLPEPQTIRGHCPNCGSGRKAYVRCKHVVSADEDDGTSARHTGMILECCGCERIYFRKDYWFSEWEMVGSHPITGEPVLVGGGETAYWPAPVRRQRPQWLAKIEESERELGKLLLEMYAALDNDLRVLAAIAARTVFDRASELLQVDPTLTFKEKLDRLGADRRISLDEEETLQVLVDAGSAAAHRGWRPEADELNTMVDVVESFLQRSFILGDGIEKLKASVPQKRRA